MQKVILIFCFLSITSLVYSQTNLMNAKNNLELKKKIDSAMISSYFITNSDAGKILEKPAHVIDSACKFSSNILRYRFDYVADYKDSTSKGKIFFTFEQYKNDTIAKGIYQSIKSENEKNAPIMILNDIGEESFLQRDNLNEPFIIIRKENKLFKLKVYYLTSKTSLEELIKVSKKIAMAH